MPQGGKKTPFSGKLKKAQLQAKRERKVTNLLKRGKRSLAIALQAGGGGYLGKYAANPSSGGAGADGGEGDGEEQDDGHSSHFTV